MKELIERVRGFETDHAPDGWPAIRMREVSALADAIEELQRELDNERARDIHSCHANCTRVGCVNRRLREQNEELTAALAAKDEALLDVARKAEVLKKACGMDPESPQAIRNGEYMNISYAARAALSIQPHAALVAKIKADAVREFCRAIDSIDDGESPAYRHVQELGGEYADRIEKG